MAHARTPRTALGFEPIVWAAGVFDVAGTCATWEVAATGAWRWRISLYIDEPTAAAWQRAVGVTLHRDRVRRWTVRAEDGYDLVARLLPYLQVRHDEASALLRTIVMRGRGRVTVVDEYRSTMRDQIRDARTGRGASE